MTNPVTPPPELVQQWVAEIWHEGTPVRVSLSDEHIATRAAQYGADQELQACCQWLEPRLNPASIDDFRAARRPKSPSLKEQALKVLESVAVHELYGNATADNRLSADDMRTIRRALEALPDD